jgi:hypothetical protein
VASRARAVGDVMKVYRIELPRQCDIEGCINQDAVVVLEADGHPKAAICPEHVQEMSDLNSDNAEALSGCECEHCQRLLALDAKEKQADLACEQLL